MIRLYEDNDKKQLVDIVFHYWGNEINVSKRLKDLIYYFLVDYYTFNNDISFVSEENDKINSFILLNYIDDENKSVNRFINELYKLSKEEKENGLKYLEYLKNNTLRIKKYIKPNDVYFGLIASIKHHEGENILNYAIEVCKSKNIKNGYFWTDETCNYKFYENKGFELIEEFNNDFFGNNIKTFVYKIILN